MRTIPRIGVFAALFTLLSTSALAQRQSVHGQKLIKPRHTNYYRSSALRVAGLDWAARRSAKVTQIGVTNRGETIMMVKSPNLKVPAIVAARETGRWDSRVFKLTSRQVRNLGLITPARALSDAVTSGRGALFRKVRGKIEFAGASNSGQSYKFVVTPKKPVKVRDPYGMHTITKLNRYVNVNGTGETAQPAGNSSWTYIPRPR